MIPPIPHSAASGGWADPDHPLNRNQLVDTLNRLSDTLDQFAHHWQPFMDLDGETTRQCLHCGKQQPGTQTDWYPAFYATWLQAWARDIMTNGVDLGGMTVKDALTFEEIAAYIRSLGKKR